MSQEAVMSMEVPFTNKPEDIVPLFEKLPTIQVPENTLGTDYFKSLGFSAVSSKQLFSIFKLLGFVDEQNHASDIWKAYAYNDNRATVLASAVKNAYPALFDMTICPYLEEDVSLMDYLQQNVKSTPKKREYMLQTFRALSEPADWQDILCEEGQQEQKTELPAGEPVSNAKVDPNLHLNIQIHIAPETPDDKIETIFKNMRKYLLDKK
jgi:hypothetical protein